MSTVYRVISRAGKVIGETDSIDGVVEIAKKARSGRYAINKVWLDPSSGDQKSWTWGKITKSRDGRIELDLPPWVD
jgi:hypothetical protein